MNTWLDLRRLRYFVSIVQNGSVSEASRVLNIAQPALTHHLREMERGYGEPLLVRSSKGITMTPAGEILFSCANDLLERLNLTLSKLDELKSTRTASKKLLKISAISSLASAITPGLLAAADKMFPGVTVHISEKSAHESRDLIAEGKLDFAITLDSHEGERNKLLVHEELLFVLAPTSEDHKNTLISLNDLSSYRLILPSTENSVLRPYLEALLRRHKLALTPTLEIDGLGPRKEAVLAGLGATISPYVSVAAELTAGTLMAYHFEPRITRRIILRVRQGVDERTVAPIQEMIISVLNNVTRFV